MRGEGRGSLRGPRVLTQPAGMPLRDMTCCPDLSIQVSPKPYSSLSLVLDRNAEVWPSILCLCCNLYAPGLGQWTEGRMSRDLHRV